MLSAADVLRGQGGQFAGSVSRGGAKPTTGGRAPSAKASKAAKAAAARKAAANAPMSYDPRTGRGTGYGHKGGDKRVRQLQQALNQLGLRDGHGKALAVDGQLGPLTTHAVMNAQRALGLKPDGVVTPQLLSQITALAAKHPAAGAKPAPKRTARSMMRHSGTPHRAVRKAVPKSKSAAPLTRNQASASRTRGD